MPKVEPISVINVDETPIAVEGCSDTVKQLVSVYNQWRQVEADDKDKLMLTQAGLRDVTREIVVTVRKEQEAEAAEAAANDAEATEEVVEEAVVVEDAAADDGDVEGTDPADA